MTITIKDKKRVVSVYSKGGDINIEDMLSLIAAVLVAYGYHVKTVEEYLLKEEIR